MTEEQLTALNEVWKRSRYNVDKGGNYYHVGFTTTGRYATTLEA